MAAAQGVDAGMPSFNNKTHSVLHSSLGAGGNAPKSGLPTTIRHLVPIPLRLTAKEEDLASKDLSWPSREGSLTLRNNPPPLSAGGCGTSPPPPGLPSASPLLIAGGLSPPVFHQAHHHAARPPQLLGHASRGHLFIGERWKNNQASP